MLSKKSHILVRRKISTCWVSFGSLAVVELQPTWLGRNIRLFTSCCFNNQDLISKSLVNGRRELSQIVGGSSKKLNIQNCWTSSSVNDPRLWEGDLRRGLSNEETLSQEDSFTWQTGIPSRKAFWEWERMCSILKKFLNQKCHDCLLCKLSYMSQSIDCSIFKIIHHSEHYVEEWLCKYKFVIKQGDF